MTLVPVGDDAGLAAAICRILYAPRRNRRRGFRRPRRSYGPWWYGASTPAGHDGGGVLGAEDWHARLGWRLIRWGTRLRQRAESSGRTGLTSPKKKTRTATAR
jgi:hypothetical protein